MIIMAERKLSSSGTFPFSFFTVFLFSHCVFFLYHLQCFSSVSVTLFYSRVKSNKEQLVKHSRKQKNVTKKCNLAVEEIRGGGFERASFCLKCAIYLSERMHIVSIYTSRTHFATGWRAQKLRELITFFIIIYKVIYL